MSFKVLNAFKEKEHEGTIYSVGDIYPKDDHAADLKRVSFLQGIHSEYGVRFLGEAEGVPITPKVEDPVVVEDKEPTNKATTPKKESSKKKSDAK